MPETILIDNDVVLKMSAYAAGNRLVEIATLDGNPPSILVVAGFALRKQVERSRRIVDRAAAAGQLALFLDGAERIEPTEDEIAFAAELEERAQQLDLELDAGESQLVSILLHRRGPLMITGDKRALKALDAVAPAVADHRIACLEQAMASAVAGEHLGPIRTAACAERDVDRAIAMCCACSTVDVVHEQVLEGLRSYVADLRRSVGRLLISSDDLVAIVPEKDRVGLG